MGSEGERKVRIEAGDRRLSQLTPEQKTAALAARALLENYASLTPPESRPESWYLPWVDHQRGNPVVLLDGGRGSGKSTVLLSLVRVWAEPWDPRMGVPPGGKADAEAWESDKRALDAPEFVPLDVLDLQTLPNDASLLFRVAGLFQRVVAATATHSRGSDGARTAARPREAWRRLVTAIATGWEGATKGRNQQVDPEIFALELEKAERQGLDVAIEFRRFIDHLIDGFMELRRGYFPKDGPRRPLFIVPIDDADMNPQKTPELVKLIRLIWHPRVAFLLAGKTEHFLAALERDYRAGKDLSDQEEARAYAQELFNRVVPPDQRLGFTQLSNKRRPDLTALGLKETGQEKRTVAPSSGTPTPAASPPTPTDPSVRELLERIELPQLDPGDPKRSMWNVLDDNPIGERALPGVLRELQDLRGRLARICSSPDEDARSPKWWQALEALWRFALRRQAYSPAVMRRVQDMIRYDDTGIVVAAGDMVWDHATAAMHRFPLMAKDGTLVLQRWFSPCGRLQTSQGAPAVEIPEQVAAVLLLATDLVAEGHGSFVGSSPAQAMAQAGLVTVQVQNEDGKTLELPWPLPRWDASWPYLELEERWRTCATARAAEETFGWLDTARFIRTAATYLRLIGEVVSRETTTRQMLTAPTTASTPTGDVDTAQQAGSPTAPPLLGPLSKLNVASSSRRSAAQQQFIRMTVWILCEATSGLDPKLDVPMLVRMIAAVAPPKPDPQDIEKVVISHYRDLGIKKPELEFARGLLRDHRDHGDIEMDPPGPPTIKALHPSASGTHPLSSPESDPSQQWERLVETASSFTMTMTDFLMEPPGSLAYYLSRRRATQAFPFYFVDGDPARAVGVLQSLGTSSALRAVQALAREFPASWTLPTLTRRVLFKATEGLPEVAIYAREQKARPLGELLSFLVANVEVDLGARPAAEATERDRLPRMPFTFDGRPCPWPSVAWPAPLDGLLLLAALGSHPLPKRGARHKPDGAPGLIALASRYLWAVFEIATKRDVSGDVPSILEAMRALRSMPLDEFITIERPMPRALALRTFVESLGLFAAPEALLPPESATAILLDLDADTFRELERDRDRQDVATEPPDHPWVVRKRELGIKP